MLENLEQAKQGHLARNDINGSIGINAICRRSARGIVGRRGEAVQQLTFTSPQIVISAAAWLCLLIETTVDGTYLA